MSADPARPAQTREHLIGRQLPPLGVGGDVHRGSGEPLREQGIDFPRLDLSRLDELERGPIDRDELSAADGDRVCVRRRGEVALDKQVVISDDRVPGHVNAGRLEWLHGLREQPRMLWRVDCPPIVVGNGIARGLHALITRRSAVGVDAAAAHDREKLV